MKRVLPLIVLSAVALLSLPVGHAAAHKPIPPGWVAYEMSYTGLVFVKYKDTGSVADANCPQFQADQTPFSETDSVKVAWTSTWQFAFNPSGSKTSAVHAKSTKLHGSNYSFSGTFVSSNTCAPVKFGAQGPCAGVVKNDARGLVIVRHTKARKNEDLVMHIQPFGPLTPSPGSCMDNDSPPATHMLKVELTALSNALAVHAFSTSEVLGRGVSRTKQWNIDLKDDCSHPGPDPGDTDTCSTTTTGGSTLELKPINDG